MRFKSTLTFLPIPKSHHGIRSYGHMGGQYSGMMNITRAYQREMNHLRKSLGKVEEEILMNAIYSRLGILNTYHSLKMTEGFSLT
ncbi:MAG: hypothetical protein K2X39_06650 [Silvanigrellaceae bacterium]|nr:hypothetical protein [Silvanigrellaceae bacterium]